MKTTYFCSKSVGAEVSVFEHISSIKEIKVTPLVTLLVIFYFGHMGYIHDLMKLIFYSV